MQFLRTIFWVALAILGAAFATNNWRPVTVRLWSDIVLDTPLPMLMLGSFLLGLVPMIVVHRATRWSMRRRLDSTQRELNETRLAREAASGDAPLSTVPPGAVPLGGASLVPPPGVA